MAREDLPCKRVHHRPELLDRRVVDVGKPTRAREIEVVVGIVVEVPQDSLLGGKGEAVLPRDPLLRFDQDDSRRRLGAIQCGRRRALHHLDVGDVLRVDIVQPRHRLPIAEVEGARPRARLVADPDPVDVDDRVVVLRQTRRPSHPNGRAAPHAPRRLGDRHPGGSRVQQLGNVRDRPLINRLLGIEALDVGTHLRPPQRRRGNRGDHFTQLHRLRRKHEIHRRRLPHADCHRFGCPIIPDRAGLDRVATQRNR